MNFFYIPMSEAGQKISALLPYIPASITQNLAQNSSGFPRVVKKRGAILLFDLVGFTRQIAEFSKQGKEGIEKFQNALSGVFGQTLEIVESFGGIAYQFAGDSVLIGFERKSDEEDFGAALRAISCVYDVYALRENPEKKILPFKISLSYGDYSEVLLGNKDHNYTLSIIGKPVVRAALLNQDAPSDRPVLDFGILEFLPGALKDFFSDSFKVTSNRPPELCEKTHLAPGHDTFVEILTKSNSLKKCSQFVLPSLYNKLIVGQKGFLGEFRDTVSVFIKFKGDLSQENEEDITRSAGFYNQFYLIVKQKVAGFMGNLFQVDLSDKGNVFFVVFGAPVAIEQKEAIAARFSLSLLQETLQTGFPENIKIGITCGLNYCGDLGAQFRKEYSVNGKSVNMASRLMDAAKENQILIDESTYSRISRQFNIKFLANQSYKGMEGEIPTYILEGEKKEQNAEKAVIDNALIGRAKEMTALGQTLQNLLQGKRQLTLIEGEAGMGKSRIFQAYASQLKKNGVLVYDGASYPYEQFTPYFVWRQILAGFFDLRASGDRTDSEKAVHKIAEHLNEIADVDPRWAPALATIMGIPAEENLMTQEIDAKQKKDRVFDILSKLFYFRARQNPVAICLEDAHWADDVSLSLVKHLLHANEKENDTAKIALVLITRYSPQLEKFKSLPFVTLVELGDMDVNDTTEFIRIKLNLQNRDEKLEKMIASRANGNPFFIENIVQTLHEQKYLEKTSNNQYRIKKYPDILSIPNSIQDIIQTRIDRLDETAQIVIKTASVVGRIFHLELVKKALPPALEVNLVSAMENLQSLDLTPLESENPLAYIFKHILIREVAYNALLVSTRRDLHRKIGEMIEENHSGNLADIVNILAYHFENGKEYTKAINYALVAANTAKNQYANNDAVYYFTKTLEMLELEHSHPKETKYKTLENLAQVYRQMGEYEKSLECFSGCLDFYGSEKRLQEEAFIYIGMAKVYFETGDLPGSVAKLERALTLLGNSAPSTLPTTFLSILYQAGVQAFHYFCPALTRKVPPESEAKFLNQTRLLKTLVNSYYFVDVNKLVWGSLFELNLAERIGNDKALSGAWSNYATVLQSVGMAKLAEKYYNQALEKADRANDPALKALALERYGTLAMYTNNLEFGRSLLDKSVSLFAQIGDMWEMIMAIYINAHLWQYEGNLKNALARYVEHQEISRKINSGMHMAWSAGDIAFINHISKKIEYDDFSKVMSESIESARKASDVPGEVIMFGFECRAVTYRGDAQKAQEIAKITFKKIKPYKVIIPHIQMAFVYAGEAALFAASKESSASERKKLLKIAKTGAKKAISLGKMFPYLSGPGWRLAGMTESSEGKTAAAKNSFQKALKILEAGPNREDYAIALCEAGIHLNEPVLFEKGSAMLSQCGNVLGTEYYLRKYNEKQGV